MNSWTDEQRLGEKADTFARSAGAKAREAWEEVQGRARRTFVQVCTQKLKHRHSHTHTHGGDQGRVVSWVGVGPCGRMPQHLHGLPMPLCWLPALRKAAQPRCGGGWLQNGGVKGVGGAQLVAGLPCVAGRGLVI